MSCARKFQEQYEPRRRRTTHRLTQKKQPKYPPKKIRKHRLCREYSVAKESMITYFPKEDEVDTWVIHTHGGLDEYCNCTGKLCDGKSMLCAMSECPKYLQRIKEAKAEGRYHSECHGCVTSIGDTPSKEWGGNVSTCVTQAFAQKLNFRSDNTVKLIASFLMTPPKRKRFSSWDSMYDDSDDEWNYA